jgi:hypothetical protein
LKVSGLRCSRVGQGRRGLRLPGPRLRLRLVLRVRAGRADGHALADAARAAHGGQPRADRQRLRRPPPDDRVRAAGGSHPEDRRGVHPPPWRWPDRRGHELGDVPPRSARHIRPPGRGRAVDAAEQDDEGRRHPVPRASRAWVAGPALSTNAWDPSEQSVAQREYESRALDVYRQFKQPPASLSYRTRWSAARSTGSCTARP